MKDSFCSTCGTAYADTATWPRVCGACGDIKYRNPIPVAVAVIPVTEGGVVLIRRSIAPCIGELALPGGYITYGESWQEGLIREVYEEIPGLQLAKESVSLFRTISTPNGGQILIFGITESVTRAQVEASPISDEVSEIVIVTEPQKLAFSTHTDVLRWHFEKE